ncbi:MAG: DUF5017 domain-containing protein [Paludibacter sp.]|nr:DUF5017 domain-containing protein [Paludibacter sp.]
MKNLNIVFVIALLLFVNSCELDNQVDMPDFDVTVDAVTYQVGDTVSFNFKGNPDIISFYSGEVFNNYNFKDGRELLADISVRFQSQILDGAQDDQFFVVVSTDFNGVYVVDSVKAATWTDITSRFKIATHADNRQYVSSGDVDITDLLSEDGSPLYFGFHYINRPNTAYGRYNLWRFSGFNMSAVTDLATQTVIDQGTAGWKIVQEGEWESGRVTVATSNFTFRGNVTNKEVHQEAWGISLPLYIDKKTDFGPDRATPLKSFSEPSLELYNYVYTQPGTYEVVFIAANSNVYGRKEIVKRLNIEIIP